VSSYQQQDREDKTALQEVRTIHAAHKSDLRQAQNGYLLTMGSEATRGQRDNRFGCGSRNMSRGVKIGVGEKKVHV